MTFDVIDMNNLRNSDYIKKIKKLVNTGVIE